MLAAEKRLSLLNMNAQELLAIVPYNPSFAKVLCSLVWWCKEDKNESYVRFTNSDETLIRNFLTLFRQGFLLDERKFRVLVHVHQHHNEKPQKQFWSRITKIPLNQFHKSFQKANTGKRQHDNYQGCIAITYYDAKIAKELEAIYNAFTLQYS